ncbi:hypothetical protein [Haloplanus aerogenes]|uniref:CARDB domain-containing protein n=1 Tax=Haloplanus aerogenes TaxID=660522 RepID=A0A3M0D264_9EURY|nr:hypothetical protein [Haloplanus aerogenes]AZH27041.1 hypothetical protein DU502_17390 [Haloplanus aerogenes]RMB13466.1 hypothetical protein ATH50_2803 [Haloplanus aerogenes]
MPSRRAVVSGIGVALSAGLAGCGALSGPDPTVVETEVDEGIDALIGDTDIFVTVENEGSAGEVSVTLELLDGEGTVLLDETQTTHMEADERKRVTFSVDVPEGTEDVRASASAA